MGACPGNMKISRIQPISAGSASLPIKSIYSHETCMSLPLTQQNEYWLMQASSPLKINLF
jgi:hypothetical protein